MRAYCRFAVSYSTCATAIVIPRSRSSGALSIDPNSRTATALIFVCNTFVIADVSVVLPWSMCPIVPTFTCGFVRSYFAFAMGLASDSFVLAGSGARRRLAGDLRHDLFGDRRRNLFVSRKLHRGRRPSLRHRAEVRHVPEHLPEGHVRADDLGGAARLHRDDAAAAAVQV